MPWVLRRVPRGGWGKRGVFFDLRGKDARKVKRATVFAWEKFWGLVRMGGRRGWGAGPCEGLEEDGGRCMVLPVHVRGARGGFGVRDEYIRGGGVVGREKFGIFLGGPSPPCVRATIVRRIAMPAILRLAIQRRPLTQN
jgi:hypothetical protein